MSFKRQTCLAFIVLLTAAGLHAEILAWQSGTGKTFVLKTTVKESVTGLHSVTAKPAETAASIRDRQADADDETYIPRLRNIPSFSGADLNAGAVWTKDGTVLIDLSDFGQKEPVPVRVSVSYTLVGMTERAGRSLFHIQAEWYPLYILSPAISRRTGIERLAGASRMEIYWDNAEGYPAEAALTEEIQYRFTEKTALLLTRKTGAESKENIR